MRHVKVCGARTVEDVETIAAGGADLIGLWQGVPGGHAELVPTHLDTLAGAAAVLGVRPVLVTLLRDAAAISAVLRRAAVPVVQLHGYQPPGLVRALKRETGTTVVKVLHVGPDGCPEQDLIDAYRRAGTDLFLIDAATRDGRVGSTGHRVAADQVLQLADRCGVPFLLAGGIDAHIGVHRPVLQHPLFAGVDVDTGARTATGDLDRHRIAALAGAWREATPTAVPA